MGQPAAKQGDMVVGMDIHIINIPSPSGAVPTPLPHPFSGPLDSNCATSVMIANMPAAVMGSIAHCSPPHIPQGGPFAIPPTMQGSVMLASNTVLVEGKGLARNNDLVQTCTDAPWPSQPKIIAVSTVEVGG